MIPLKKSLTFLWEERIIFFSTVVISLYTTTNVVVLGFFDSIENIGYFTTGQNLVNITTTVLTVPLSAALYPYLGSTFSKSKENGLEVANKILPVIFYLVSISCLILFLLSPYLVTLLYGIKFNNSILPLQVLAFSPLIISLSNFFGIQIMLNLNMDRIFFKILSICGMFGIMSNILMSSQWGYIGTAFNVLIVEFVVTLFFYLALRKRGINVIRIKNFMPKEFSNHLKSLLQQFNFSNK